MKTITLKLNSNTKTLKELDIATKDGIPNLIQAVKNVNYELINTATGKAPDHIIIKRIKNDLHLSFEDGAEETDLIIERFYETTNSALIGLAEDGNYYYYIPDNGQISDYVTQLDAGHLVGQALGGNAYPTAWWLGESHGDIVFLDVLFGMAALGSVGSFFLSDKEYIMPVAKQEEKKNDNEHQDNSLDGTFRYHYSLTQDGALADMNTKIDGGDGRDTLYLLPSSDNVLDLAKVDAFVSNIEVIDLANKVTNTLSVKASDVLGLTDMQNTLFVNGDGDDMVDVDEATLTRQTTSDMADYSLYTGMVDGQMVKLYIDSDITKVV